MMIKSLHELRAPPGGFVTLTDNYRELVKFLKTAPPTEYPLLRHHIRRIRFHDRLRLCCRPAKLTVKCRSCGHIKDDGVHDTAIHCSTRYCSKPGDVVYRFGRSYSRLMRYGIRSGRLLHVVYGFETQARFYRAKKKASEEAIRMFRMAMLRYGVNLRGLKIFDFHSSGDAYIHYHAAYLPIGRMDARMIMKARAEVQEITGMRFIVRVIGYRSKRSLFRYFAKRMAGLYGDGNKVVEYITRGGKKINLYYDFILQDRMTEDEYLENFYNVRSLAAEGGRLSCNIAPVVFECPLCYCRKLSVSIEWDLKGDDLVEWERWIP